MESLDVKDNEPLSEQYYKQGLVWVDLDAAARMLEETKSIVMAQRQMEYGDIAVNRSEQLVKGTASWKQHVESIVNSRTLANKAKIRLEALKMRSGEQASYEANERTMARL